MRVEVGARVTRKMAMATAAGPGREEREWLGKRRKLGREGGSLRLDELRACAYVNACVCRWM